MGVNIAIIDIIIVALVLFLAIKGLMNGFSKELLNFISIIGGVALAARFNTSIVELVNEQQILPIISNEYTKIIGFILIILLVWLIISVISTIVNRLTNHEVGIPSRLVGYILSATRYFIIFSLIIFGVTQSDFFKNQASKLEKDSQLFKPMSQVGATLLNIEVNNTVVKEDTNITTTTVVKENNNTDEEEKNVTIPSTEVALTEHNTSN